jgi:hypothetical protein
VRVVIGRAPHGIRIETFPPEAVHPSFGHDLDRGHHYGRYGEDVDFSFDHSTGRDVPGAGRRRAVGSDCCGCGYCYC